MRKDIRFGLTVGASLVGVLVIWVAIDRLGRKGTPDISTVSPTDGVQQVVSSSPTAGDGHIADSSSAQSTPATQPSSVAQSSQTSTNDASGATATSTGRDWNRLLEAGGTPTTEPSALLSDSATTAGAVSGPATTRPTAAADATASIARTHKVAAGETLYTISAALYGDSKYYMRLEDANPTINPSRLRVGAVLNVPDLKAQVVLAKVSAAEVKATTVDSSRSYRVRSSDTLMAIARKLYGNGQEWEKIYDANRDAIGPNPARLKVDMVLRLPDPPTLAAAN